MTFPDDYVDKVICGDCLEVMKDIPDNSVDLVLTDPPYGITACEWDTVPDLAKLWEILKRIGKPNCVYVFTASQPFTTDLINSNRKWFKYEWIWDKGTGKDFVNCNRRPLKSHENILVFYGQRCAYNPQKIENKLNSTIKRQLCKTGYQDSKSEHYGNCKAQKVYKDNLKFPISIIKCFTNNCNNQFQRIETHPTQKPIELMKYLVLTYSNPGDIILDPFAGSGTTLVAAKDLDRRFIGIELNQGYVDICHKRLNAVHPKLELK